METRQAAFKTSAAGPRAQGNEGGGTQHLAATVSPGCSKKCPRTCDPTEEIKRK